MYYTMCETESSLALTVKRSEETEYNTISGRVKNIIKKHWGLLKCDPYLQHISASVPRFYNKRAKNIVYCDIYV